MINWAIRILKNTSDINWDEVYYSVSSTVPPTGILINSEQLSQITIEPPVMKMTYIEIVDGELVQMLLPCPEDAIGWWYDIPVFVS